MIIHIIIQILSFMLMENLIHEIILLFILRSLHILSFIKNYIYYKYNHISSYFILFLISI